MGKIGGYHGEVQRGVIGLGLVMCLATGPLQAADGFDAHLRAARLALRNRDFKAGRQACRAAHKAAEEPEIAGPRTAKALELCARIEMAADRPKVAMRKYRDAAHAAVYAPKLRRKYLAGRRRAAYSAKRKRAAKAVTQLLQEDAKVQGILRRPRRNARTIKAALETLEHAKKVYLGDRDRQQARLTDAVRALVFAESAEPVRAKKLAKRVLAQPAPATVIQPALKALYLAHANSGAPRPAAEAAVRLDMLRYDEKVEARRRFARGRELKRACRALDADAGAGTCARLQLKMRGFVALIDHSRRRTRGRLTQSQLDRVHAEALPALEGCVLKLARADPDRYKDEELKFSWTIGPKGRPLNIEVRPRRHVEGAKACTEGTIAWFRYPRPPASAERTNVSVPYRLD